MYHLPSNKNLNEFKRQLRIDNTLPEKLVWYNLLRQNQTGHTFTRQYNIGNYILDFYCKKLKLNIELDGKTHDATFDEDIIRDKYLTNLGIKVLRIGNTDVLYNLDGVRIFLEEYLKSNFPNGKS
jgi:very-short-patch-repair endonuclease